MVWWTRDRRAVLRDLRDICPKSWRRTAKDWGGDSKFYAAMARKVPLKRNLSTEDYRMLTFETEPGVTLCKAMAQEELELAAEVASLLPTKLSDWTALTLDDMTGEGTSCEEYHLSRAKAEAESYTVVHWSKMIGYTVDLLHTKVVTEE